MAPRRTATGRTVVLSLGGSLFLTGEDDRTYLKGLAELLRSVGRTRPLAVVVGGGTTARRYIDLGRSLGLTEVELDELGIEVTRLHARLLAALLGPPTPSHPPVTVASAVQELARASPVVLGGTEPGHTTDGVGALVAVRTRAERFVNATKVGALFDRDPNIDTSARPIPKLSWAEFRDIVRRSAGDEAGQRFVFDRLGAELLHRARIPVAIVNGRDLRALGAALTGRAFPGTRVA